MAEATPTQQTGIATLLTIERNWHESTPSTSRLGLKRDDNGKLYRVVSAEILSRFKDKFQTLYAYRDVNDLLVYITGRTEEDEIERIYDLVSLHNPITLANNNREEYTSLYITTLQARYDSYKNYRKMNMELSYSNKAEKMICDGKLAGIALELDKWIGKQIIIVMNRYFAVIRASKPYIVIRKVNYDKKGHMFLCIHRMDQYSFVSSGGYGGTTMPGEGMRRPKVATFWLDSENSRSQYDKLVFCEKPHPNSLNLWRGSPLDNQLDGIDPNNARRWIDHTKRVVKGGEKVSERLFDFLAYKAQNPMKRPNAAILLRCSQGGGKGYIIHPFRHIFSDHYQYQRSAQACGRFTMSLANCCVLVIDEAGDWSQEQIDLMKTYITSDELTHEEKGLPLVSIENCMMVVIMTNNEHCKLIERSDRRIFAVDLEDIYCGKTQENRNYWNMAWGVSSIAIYKWLLARDIRNFDPTDFPITDAAREQKEYGFNSVETWWVAELREENDSTKSRDIFGQLIPKNDIYDRYIRWSGKYNKHAKVVNPTWFWRKLTYMLDGQLDMTKTTNVRYIGFPSLDVAKKLFANFVKDPLFFGNDCQKE